MAAEKCLDTKAGFAQAESLFGKGNNIIDVGCWSLNPDYAVQIFLHAETEY